MANIRFKKIIEKRAQESSSSIDSKLVYHIVQSILDENSNQMELWKVHHEHLTSVAQSDGKDERTCFDPVLMNWITSLLVKTLKSVYIDIVKVIKLQSCSWVMKMQQHQ